MKKCFLYVLVFLFVFSLASFAADQNTDVSEKVAKFEKLFGKLKFYGDLKLRWEGIDDREYEGDSNPWRPADNTDLPWRNRFRYSYHLGLDVAINDEIDLRTRFASGPGGTTVLETMDGNFINDPFNIDQAYLVYRPSWFDRLTLYGGKMKNPMYTTRMVWDADVNPEGFAWTTKWEDILNSSWDLFTNSGFFVFNENAGATADGWVSATGGGLEGNVLEKYDLKFGANYYHWQNSEQGAAINASTNATAPGYGNIYGFLNNENLPSYGALNILSHYGVAEFKGELKTRFNDWPVQIVGSYINNLGAKKDNVRDSKTYDTGYYIEAKVGDVKEVGDWYAGYIYTKIDPDATPAGINDATSLSTNIKQHEINAGYKFLPNSVISGNMYLTSPVRRLDTFSGVEARDRRTYIIDVTTNF